MSQTTDGQTQKKKKTARPDAEWWRDGKVHWRPVSGSCVPATDPATGEERHVEVLVVQFVRIVPKELGG